MLKMLEMTAGRLAEWKEKSGKHWKVEILLKGCEITTKGRVNKYLAN